MYISGIVLCVVMLNVHCPAMKTPVGDVMPIEKSMLTAYQQQIKDWEHILLY